MAVAPHAGARIETIFTLLPRVPRAVAPHAGARIETCKKPALFDLTQSLPMRERELKLAMDKTGQTGGASLPMRERGLKHGKGCH